MSALPVVIFMTSNGVGMGHLSRQLTLALSGPQQFEAVLFSLSGALPRVMAADVSGELPEAHDRGVRYEYCPSRDSGWLPKGGWQRIVRERYRSYRWHPYVRDRLVALATETGASVIVFDGVVPYDGLIAAREILPGVAFVWMRRGMWLPEAKTRRLRHSATFDLVIEPGDFGSAADHGPLVDRDDATRIAPVALTNVLAPDSREHARAALGLPLDQPVLLLAPGSGALGSVEETAARIQRQVAATGPEWVIAVTRQSIVAHTISDASTSLVVLDDVYPLARHFSAFDAAVSAAGYNSVHELLGSAVPTLLVPSVHHVTDDQGARARGVVDRGAALLPVHDHLENAVAEVMSEGVRADLRKACATLEDPDGGMAAADLIGALACEAQPAVRHFSLATPPRPRLDARTPAQGPNGTPLRFEQDISVAQVRGPSPVEHLLSHSSAEYRAARIRTASWLYSSVGRDSAR